MSDYISREAAFNGILKLVPKVDNDGYCWVIRGDAATAIESIPAADVRPVPDGGIGEMSDGYHTFNGLYYQRMVLFAALVKAHKDKAWKSWKHEDGEPCFGGGWFIVGIDTPQGSYTYHYEAKDFDLFDCKELPVAKHWDGHTEEDVTRLLSLDVRPVVRGKWVYDHWCEFKCSNCGAWSKSKPYRGRENFCPNCGADMREENGTGGQTMFDDLIQRLHRYSENVVAYKLDADYASAVQEAADSIEELQKAVLRLEEASGILDELPMVDQREPPKEE